MKTGSTVFVLLTSLLMLSSACKAAGGKVNTQGLAITMSFVSGEFSKDSNSQSYSITLNEESISYSGPHPPCARGRCAHGKVEFKLEKKVYDEAVAAITRGDLTRAFSEEKEIGGLGNHLTVAATVTLGDKSGKTTIKGMSYSREASDGVLSKNALTRAEAVRMLLIPFRLAGEARLPKK